MAKLCKKCGAELDNQPRQCPVCGAEVRKASPKKRGHAAIWVAACLLLAAIGIGALVYGEDVPIPLEKKGEERLDAVSHAAADNGNQDGEVKDTPDGQMKEVRRLVRMDSYDENDVLQWYQTYIYDTNGEQTSVTSYDSQGNQTGYADLSTGNSYWYANCTGVVMPLGRTTVTKKNTETVTYESGYREISEYGADGRKEKQYQYPGGEESFFAYTVYEYGDAGLLARANTFLADGQLSGYVTYQYNAAGKPLKETTYDADGTVVSGSSTIYNEYGEAARKHYYTSSGRLESYHIYEYAETDRMF